ncbi:23S rRNA (guanosine(2251)-2'-O)-methyltransferase RlmB [Anoxybacter fermentans]|uniref:23S rRNA (Guanosine(2251)-2'-O)-methyltransferase RlmB n=1 Tax=Anoxybacter fermentans TaxID=1323375 RepID=A0A3Q9HR35_9FIRM|nr:23S rRNA (guanosine(2251)-2'-O)-methyltransferase RlmB [Anoxybacter fermentans]AZR73670.1 23S rRNA (guanosine(2251)-2'-O)-methyltransferase RlmB [Anoxybacter fermentans]
MITSIKNSEVKFLRSLKKKKYREREKMFFIEGVRIIEDALADGAEFVRVFYSPMLETNSRGMELLFKLREAGVDEILLDDRLFKEVADTETPQGILAILKQPEFELEDLIAKKRLYPHILMLNGIQDPGNLGTIIRTAAGAGWSGVILTKGTVDLYNPKSLRATMGAIYKMPICKVEDLNFVWKKLRTHGYQIIVAALEGKTWHFEVDFSRPTLLVVGNEGNGVEPEVLKSADQLVKIPMAPDAESLNVAIAAGIIIFEGVRQNLIG